MTQTLPDRLISVLDAYIDEYGGGIRLRGVLTALLVLKHTLSNRGISVSEVSRATGGPLENVRRHFGKYVQQDVLIARPDPDDERVTRYRFVDIDGETARASRVAKVLAAIGPPARNVSGNEPHPFSAKTCETLMAALLAFTGTLDSGLRIRAFKIAIVMHQAGQSGKGITASEIARVSGAPLETVRRTLQRYLEMGNLKVMGDPDDERVSRVLYRDPDFSAKNITAIGARLEQVDWSEFNVC